MGALRRAACLERSPSKAISRFALDTNRGDDVGGSTYLLIGVLAALREGEGDHPHVSTSTIFFESGEQQEGATVFLT